MKSLLYYFVFSGLLIISSSIYSQDLEIYTSPYVKCLAESDGFLWAGGCGLSKINIETGEIEHYTTANSELPHNKINDLLIDGQDNLWIAGGNGLACYSNGNWQVIKSLPGDLNIGAVYDIAIDEAKGIIYFAADNGRIIYTDGNEWDYWDKNNSDINVNSVYSVELDGQSRLWIGVRDGVLMFDGSTFTKYSSSNSAFNGSPVRSILRDYSGNLWFASEGNAIKYSQDSWSIQVPPQPGISAGDINCIAYDMDGLMWFGALSSAISYDGSNWNAYYSENSGLKDYKILAIIPDKSGNLWFGTEKNGVIKYNGENWQEINTANSALPGYITETISFDPSGNTCCGTNKGIAKFDGFQWQFISDDIVNGIKHDNEGNAWLGTNSKGLMKYNGIEAVYFNIDNSGIPSNNIKSIAISPDNNICCASDKGLGIFDGTTWELYQEWNSEIPDNNVQYICFDKSGDAWLIIDYKVYKFEDGIFSRPELPSSVYSICFDNSNKMWINSNHKLYMYDGTDYQQLPLMDDENQAVSINCIYAHSNDKILIGTNKGMVEYDNGNWEQYTQESHKLPDHNIYSINSDKEGKFWVGTGAGLAVMHVNSSSVNEQQIFSQGISTYPNPVQNNRFTILLGNLFINNPEVKILTMDGNEIPENSYSISKEKNRIIIESQSLTSGNYIISVAGNNNSITKKIVIVK